MARRIFCFTLIVVFLTFTGCYQVSQVSMTEFMEVHHPSEAYFQTGDSLAYHVGKASYKVANDSVYVYGFEVRADETKVPYRGVVPVDSISSVKVESLDVTNTGLVLSGGVLLLGLFIAAAAMPGFGGGGVGGAWK